MTSFLVRGNPILADYQKLLYLICDLASENGPYNIFNPNGVISIMLYSLYLALPSGAGGASICASVPELQGETGRSLSDQVAVKLAIKLIFTVDCSSVQIAWQLV